MSLLSRLVGSTINKVLAPSEANADLRELERQRREMRAVANIEAQARLISQMPDVSDLDKLRAQQAANDAYWNAQWSAAQRMVKRHWR